MNKQMIRVLLFDFARVLLFPKDNNYSGKLNDLYKAVKDNNSFDFESNFHFNEELLEYLRNIKGEFRLVMFTSENIQEDPVVKEKLNGIFEEVISAKELFLSKSDPKVYGLITSKLGCSADEILFVDDSKENIRSAVSVGINTHLFSNTHDLLRILELLRD